MVCRFTLAYGRIDKTVTVVTVMTRMVLGMTLLSDDCLWLPVVGCQLYNTFIDRTAGFINVVELPPH